MLVNTIFCRNLTHFMIIKNHVKSLNVYLWLGVIFFSTSLKFRFFQNIVFFSLKKLENLMLSFLAIWPSWLGARTKLIKKSFNRKLKNTYCNWNNFFQQNAARYFPFAGTSLPKSLTATGNQLFHFLFTKKAKWNRAMVAKWVNVSINH